MKVGLAACAALALATAAAAQAPAPLFAGSDPIHVTITAPFPQLMKNRDYSGNVPGTLTGPGGETLPVALGLRGITRRSADICDFPPLRVDFTAVPPASVFAGQRKLKLVTHCRNSGSFQQQVLLEYAAYRMFNQLSPRSFRVRLANIDYRDSNGRPIISRVGFFIEDLKDVAQRNGLREAHAPERIPLADLSAPESALYAMFQDMLGNHDWSMRAGPAGEDCCHNAKMIGAVAPGAAVPIPYDFDFSGMVDAPYALPPEALKIGNVKQRLYRGYCSHNAEALAAARQLRATRLQILAVLSQTPGLEPRTQQRAAAYLERFFADIATDSDVSAKVLKSCVG